MKTKKNTLTLVLVLVLGLTLFTAATVAAGSTDVGYETFKDTMKNLNHEDATSAQVKVSVVDNGDPVFTMKADMVGTKGEEQFSGTVTLSDSDTDKSFEVYGQDDTMYVVDLLEGNYYQMAGSEDMHGDMEDYDHEDHDITGVEEELMDYFVGDLKDNFVVEEFNDGSKAMTFSMENSEVPTGLNLMIKAATSAEHRTDDKRDDMAEMMPFMDGFDHDGAPDLTEDVQLDSVEVTLFVDANDNVTKVSADTAISGRDSDGVDHKLKMTFEAKLGYEAVVPETIDADAYDWEIIEGSEMHGDRGHRR